MDKTLRQIFLYQKRSLPFHLKVKLSINKIKQWLSEHNHNCYVSFSGGLDSTVLLDLVRKVDYEIPAVFAMTGLEYPEIVKFVKTKENVVFIKPKLTFKDVIKKYGYPVISKEVAYKVEEIRTTGSADLLNTRMNGKNNDGKTGKLPECWKFLVDAPFKISDKCCDYLKKGPFKKFEADNKLTPFIGVRFDDSGLRLQSYLKHGCNAFGAVRQSSRPLAFWSREDIHTYIHTYNLPVSEIYNMGYQRTGCMFCMFGLHKEKPPNKFQLMKETHPQIYEYCMNELGLENVLEYVNLMEGINTKQLRLF